MARLSADHEHSVTGGRASASDPSRSRSRRRPWTVGLVVLLLLAVLAVTDRVAVGQVEQRVAELLQTELNLNEEPSVAIEGVPFLTQVVTNRYGHVELTGRGLPAGTAERPLLVDRIALDLRGVRTADRFSRISAEQLSGSAHVTWAEVTNQAGYPVTPQDGGRVQVDITANLYGQEVPFVVSARPVLDVGTQRVRLSEPQVIVAAYRIPDAIVERIAEETVQPIELSLPMDMRASDLQVGRTHLELGLSGNDVQLLG